MPGANHAGCKSDVLSLAESPATNPRGAGRWWIRMKHLFTGLGVVALLVPAKTFGLGPSLAVAFNALRHLAWEERE